MDPSKPESGWGPNPAYKSKSTVARFTELMRSGVRAITPDPVEKWITDVFVGAQEWTGQKSLEIEKSYARPEQMAGIEAMQRGEPTMGPMRESIARTPFDEFSGSGNPMASILGGADPTGASSALAAGDIIGNADMFGPMAKRAKELLKEWDNLGIKNMTMADAMDYLKRKPEGVPVSDISLPDEALRAETEMQQTKRVQGLVDQWKNQGYKPEQAFAELKQMGVDPKQYEDLIVSTIGTRRSMASQEARDMGMRKDEMPGNTMRERNVADEGVDPADPLGLGERVDPFAQDAGKEDSFGDFFRKSGYDEEGVEIVRKTYATAPDTWKKRFEKFFTNTYNQAPDLEDMTMGWANSTGGVVTRYMTEDGLTEAEAIKKWNSEYPNSPISSLQDAVKKSFSEMNTTSINLERDVPFDEDVPRGYLDSRTQRPGNEPLTPEEYRSIARPEGEVTKKRTGHFSEELTDRLRQQGTLPDEMAEMKQDVADFREDVGSGDAYEFFADLRDAKGDVKETYYTLTADLTDDTGYTTKKGTRVTSKWLKDRGFL